MSRDGARDTAGPALRRPVVMRACGAGLALGMVLAGCSATGSNSGTNGDQANGGGTFVFAASADPLTLDPATASDPDSMRITAQIFETLVTLDAGALPTPELASPSPSPTPEADAPPEADVSPEADVPPAPSPAATPEGEGASPTASPSPSAQATMDQQADPTLEEGLATGWQTQDGGQSWTFTIRTGVVFHDGSRLTPSTVCTNFDRWASLEGPALRADVAGVQREVFGDPGADQGRYLGCAVTGADTIRVDLDQPMPHLPAQLARPQFGIQSPNAMGQYGVWVDAGADPRGTDYATAHPTGTGPFRLGAWEEGMQVVLVRNDDYWGTPAVVDRVLVPTVNEQTIRADRLLTGDVGAYDQLAGPELAQLYEEEDITLVPRATRNLTYLGMDTTSQALSDPRVREAVALAIDTHTIVADTMPPGSLPAHGLTPYAPDTQEEAGQAGETDGVDPAGADWSPTTAQVGLAHDPERARALLAEAGQEDAVVRVAYPSGVSQTYLPAPEQLYISVADQLEEVGFVVEPVAMPWADYRDMIANPGSTRADLHVMGVRAETSDPAATITALTARGDDEFGLDAEEVEQITDDLWAVPAGPQRAAVATEAATWLMEEGAVVPLAYPSEHVAVSADVTEYLSHPYGRERWITVREAG